MDQFTEMRSKAFGFTLIEIVMVLVLLGILSAVAVPKYFDLQEEAQAKACQHNRGVVLSAIHMQMSAAKIADDSQLFDDSSDDKATESAKKVLKDFAIKQPPLCPSGGNFDVDAVKTSNGNYVYHVYCDVHAPKSSDGSADNDTVITKEHSAKFAEWLRDNFSLPEGQEWSNPQYGSSTDLSRFFSSNRMSAEIDSEATVNKNSMAATVADALKTGGIDTSQIIWRLNKENWPDRCQGVNCSGTIVVTIADKSDVIEKNNDQLIPVTQYKMKVNYYDPQGKPPLSLSLSEPKSTTAQLVKKKNGAYWALKP